MLDAVDRWLEALLTERLGGIWQLSRASGVVDLRLAGSESRIRLQSSSPGIFDVTNSEVPCSSWDAEREGWRSIIGAPLPAPGLSFVPDRLIQRDTDGFLIRYGILDMFYWVLSRLEEIDSIGVDQHGRFMARHSHAFRHGYLDRPVVDEWFDVLGQVAASLWPAFVRKQNAFSLKLSHDVDRPSRYGFSSASTFAYRVIRDILKGRLSSIATGPWVRYRSGSRLSSLDPLNTFDWIMSQSEERGLRSSFYFICEKSSYLDADYVIEHPAIRHLLREIYDRGHEIGLHPSYNSFDSESQLKLEAERLYLACKREGIKLHATGSRMHYLRWSHPATLRYLDSAGLTYDNTLTYPDRPGFRCGTCFEYPGFDPVRGQSLNVRVRPLVAMDVSVFGSQYMGCNHADALELLAGLKEKCRKVGGCFTLLWHNSELRGRQSLYQAVLDQ